MRARVKSLYRQFPKDFNLYVFYCSDLSITVSCFAVSLQHAEIMIRDRIYEFYGLRSVFLSHVVTVDKDFVL